MTAENIRQRIQKRLADSNLPGAEAFILLGDGERIDSVAALRLVLSLEEEFGIVVEDGDIKPQNFSDMDRLESYIRRKLEELGKREG
jgi:acyl carrier protein